MRAVSYEAARNFTSETNWTTTVKTTRRQLAATLFGALLFTSAQAQQVLIPTSAVQVPGPAAGPMTAAYVQMVGRMAYVWGWLSCTYTTSGPRSPRLQSLF